MMKTLPIITLCAVLTAPAFGTSTPWGRTALNVRMLSNACEAFRDAYDVYPPQETWLAELQATGEAVVNNRRILFVEPDTAHDAWGKAFVYRLPGIHNNNSFDLYSLGADGMTETEGDDPDDIANWHASGQWRQHYNPPAITTLHAALGAGMLVSIAIIVIARKRKQLNQASDDTA
ncbi:MAG: type II secretion system protein GspG [Phycisphaerae bacterium]|jgi:general secretion pathway protein G|nr:type II secretion system protein GspG [Phycisphaerae bacterium]